MQEVKIYTASPSDLSPPVQSESFCVDLVLASDYRELEAKCAALVVENLQLQREKDAIEAVALALRDDMQQAREQLAAAEQERENWRISFDNERYRADKLAAALNAEREKLVMANRSLIIQHIRANSAESRIAELEARTVCLPKLPVLGSTTERYEGFAAGASSMRNECANAIHAAGIKVKES